MKTLLASVIVMSALAAPVVSFAQSTDGGPTRAQVMADTAAAQKGGLLGVNDVNYPPKVEATEANQQGGAASSYGSPSFGSSQSGAPAVQMAPAATPSQSTYFGGN